MTSMTMSVLLLLLLVCCVFLKEKRERGNDAENLSSRYGNSVMVSKDNDNDRLGRER